MYYAAYLKVAGVPYLGVEIEESGGRRRGYFIFDERCTPLKPLKAQYFADSAKVSALSYGQALRYLKGELFRR